MQPVPFRVIRRKRETQDVFTLSLRADRKRVPFVPGQFNMLYAFGAGEVPISMSGDPADPSVLVHTIRAVGPVTQRLQEVRASETVGLRGPFGTGWPLAEARGKDVVVVAGGLGLAPVRSALYELLRHAKEYGRLTLLYGARSRSELLFLSEIRRWARTGRMDTSVSVDQAPRGWRGIVGHVTALVPRARFRPEETIVFVCGPEVMMRFTALAIEGRGVPRERIHLCMERSMKCGIRRCGHCQFGPHFVCDDGPVYSYARIEPWMRIRAV
jgi:NAD(P)H-flavin reductase